MSGHAQAPGAVSPVEFSAAVVAYLTEGNLAAEETLTQVCPVIEHFGAFVQNGLGIEVMEAVEPQHAEAFIESRQTSGLPANYGTSRVRRMALRMAFRAGRKLGLVRGDPTLDIDLAPGFSVAARPLTEEEIGLCRSHALSSLGDMRRSIAWALAEATARTSEMGHVRVSDIDTGCSGVWIAGSPVTEPRRAHLTDWGRIQVKRRLGVAPEANESLIVWRGEPKTVRAACSQAIKETLKAAGLHAPDVKPRSVVAWAGRKAFETGAPIEEVARMIGMRSLDQTAEFIAFDWRGEEPA